MRCKNSPKMRSGPNHLYLDRISSLYSLFAVMHLLPQPLFCADAQPPSKRFPEAFHYAPSTVALGFPFRQNPAKPSCSFFFAANFPAPVFLKSALKIPDVSQRPHFSGLHCHGIPCAACGISQGCLFFGLPLRISTSGLLGKEKIFPALGFLPPLSKGPCIISYKKEKKSFLFPFGISFDNQN